VVLAGQVPLVMSAFVTLVASMELVKNLGNATVTEAGVDSSAIRYFVCYIFCTKHCSPAFFPLRLKMSELTNNLMYVNKPLVVSLRGKVQLLLYYLQNVILGLFN
jgi:hypothetical protein